MKRYEPGITGTVKTFFSSYTVYDIINQICNLKSDAVMKWVDNIGLKPEEALIIGSYFTGAAIANALKCDVTVADINPHVRVLLDDGIRFKEGLEDMRGHWSLLVDTTGIGGVREKELGGLSADAFIVEDPTSDGSDKTIMEFNETSKRLEMVESEIKASLHTYGLGTKTSGTMTLTVEVLRRSMDQAAKNEGVLYSTATLHFFERILFREGDPERFLGHVNSTALMASSLADVDCDAIIEDKLRMIKARVRETRP